MSTIGWERFGGWWQWIGWLFNYIPWWAPYVAGAAVLALTAQYWLPLWGMVPTKIKIGIAAVGAGIALWWAGRNQGAKSEHDALKKREAGAIAQREKIDDEVHRLPDDELAKRRSRWDRD